jgi:uncharacterized protein
MRAIIPLLILFIIELYAFFAIKTVVKNKWIVIGYITFSLAIFIFIIYNLFTFERGNGQSKYMQYFLGLVLINFIPKFLITFILLSEDIIRVFEGTYHYFFSKNTTSFFHERRSFVSKIALGLAAVPFLSFLYGMTVGKYNFRVIKRQLFFPDLPDSFDGFTLTQISDIHSGSFDNKEKIEYAIDLINAQKTDVLLFTGDIVNALATEMDPWIETFQRIREPKYGKFSVLGNHDYGTYIRWNSQKEEDENFEAIKKIHDKIDFKLLLNEQVKIKKDNEEINLVGVENWGRKFGERGDLKKASEGLSKSDFKILMSHDPSHWNEKVQHDDLHYQLTLSGHTHGLQFGIEIPGLIKWSPVQYVYKQWAGLYENLGRYIYVNRGFGFHAYPGRVGIMPEITVLELKKGNKKEQNS